jgi:hypothetical protein
MLGLAVSAKNESLCVLAAMFDPFIHTCCLSLNICPMTVKLPKLLAHLRCIPSANGSVQPYLLDLTLYGLSSAALNESKVNKLTRYSATNRIAISANPPFPVISLCSPANAPSPTV